MAYPFSFGSSKDTAKDYFSTSFFTSKPAVKVNEGQALSIPAVKSSIELITNAISSLPIYLYVENELDGSITKAIDSRIDTLNHSFNNYDTAQVCKKKIVQDYLLRGKAYIYKNKGQLFHLPSENVIEQNFTEDGITVAKKEFVYSGVSTITLKENQIIVIDSGSNGLLVDSGVLFQTAISQLDFQHSLMQNSAIPSGLLKASSRLTQTAIDRLRSSFEGLYAGARKAGRTIILEEGMAYEQMSLSPDKLGLNESNKFIVSEIARVMNLPESMISSSANKYNSHEQNNVQFLQSTLSPIITAIESAFDKHLLTTEEQDEGFYFRFDTSEILRSTETEKINAISKGLKDGLYSFNEARQKLDLPKVEDNYFVLSLGNVLKDEKTGKLTILNLGQEVGQKQPGGE